MNSKGQSLLELIVVIAVGIVVVTALVFSTISSIRNSQLAKNQAQATRLAQEGIEKLRIARDRDETIVSYGLFSTVWAGSFVCPPGLNCYFRLNSSSPQQLETTTSTNYETFTGDLAQFKRLILIEDSQANEKKFTCKVIWTDFAGQHEARQTTLLRKL